MVDCVKKAVIDKRFIFFKPLELKLKVCTHAHLHCVFSNPCEGVHKQNYKNDVIAITNIVF